MHVVSTVGIDRENRKSLVKAASGTIRALPNSYGPLGYYGYE
jgi:hypothetical protein